MNIIDRIKRWYNGEFVVCENRPDDPFTIIGGHQEYSRSAKVARDSGVFAAIYSRKLPAVKNVNVDEIMKKKWISDLFGLSVDSIRKEFQQIDDGNAEKPPGDERTS